jgi:hypothetical protein
MLGNLLLHPVSLRSFSRYSSLLILLVNSSQVSGVLTCSSQACNRVLGVFGRASYWLWRWLLIFYSVQSHGQVLGGVCDVIELVENQLELLVKLAWTWV